MSNPNLIIVRAKDLNDLHRQLRDMGFGEVKEKQKKPPNPFNVLYIEEMLFHTIYEQMSTEEGLQVAEWVKESIAAGQDVAKITALVDKIMNEYNNCQHLCLIVNVMVRFCAQKWTQMTTRDDNEENVRPIPVL